MYAPDKVVFIDLCDIIDVAISLNLVLCIEMNEKLPVEMNDKLLIEMSNKLLIDMLKCKSLNWLFISLSGSKLSPESRSW